MRACDRVAAADAAMYEAKRAGRDRVMTTDACADRGALPRPVMVGQPIVDLDTGSTVAVEALSRFGDENPAEVFERAHRDGVGPELEALAIRTAVAGWSGEIPLSVNLSLMSLTNPHVDAALPQDLTGIILEVTEHHAGEVDEALTTRLQQLRRRGAVIAIDDWGTGFSNLDRLLSLRPEIVKLDMSLVHGLDSDYHRATIRSVVAWADEVGVRVCAEGVETVDHGLTLLSLGVHTAQGYLFGRPTPLPRPAVAPPGAALGAPRTPRRTLLGGRPSASAWTRPSRQTADRDPGRTWVGSVPWRSPWRTRTAGCVPGPGEPISAATCCSPPA